MAGTPDLCVLVRFAVQGGHTHVAIFAGKDFNHLAKCGDLTFRNEEWIVAQGLFTSGPGRTVKFVDNTPAEFKQP